MADRRGVSQHLVRHLRRDGYSVEDDGRIRVGSAHGLADIPLHHLSELSLILEHLDHIASTTIPIRRRDLRRQGSHRGHDQVGARRAEGTIPRARSMYRLWSRRPRRPRAASHSLRRPARCRDHQRILSDLSQLAIGVEAPPRSTAPTMSNGPVVGLASPRAPRCRSSGDDLPNPIKPSPHGRQPGPPTSLRLQLTTPLVDRSPDGPINGGFHAFRG